MKSTKRAMRRAWYENQCKKAWKEARLWKTDWHKDERDIEEIYKMLMLDEGHWMRGGCKASCWMCQPDGLSARDLRLNAQAEYELTNDNF